MDRRSGAAAKVVVFLIVVWGIGFIVFRLGIGKFGRVPPKSTESSALWATGVDVVIAVVVVISYLRTRHRIISREEAEARQRRQFNTGQSILCIVLFVSTTALLVRMATDGRSYSPGLYLFVGLVPVLAVVQFVRVRRARRTL